MKPNAFIGHKKQPSGKELSVALGPTYRLWSDLIAELHLPDEEWNSYSLKYGWSLKLKQKKRTILHLGPREGSFQIAFILGERALAAARSSKFPRHILDALAEAKKYPEGTAVRIEVTKASDLAGVKELAAIKMAN